MNILSFSKHRYISYCLIFYFICPTFWGYINVSEGQLLYNLLTIVISYAPLLVLRKSTIPAVPLLLFGSLFLAYCTTLSINQITSGGGINPKDYTDILRPVFYIAFFSIPLFINYRPRYLKDTLHTFFLIAFGVLVLDLIKFVPAFYPVMRLYSVFQPLSLNYVRFSGTFSYCYNYGYVLIFPFVFLLLYGQHKLIKLFLFLTIAILIGSRSVLLAFSVVLILLFLNSDTPIIKKVGVLITAPIILMIILTILRLLEIDFIQDILDNIEKLYNALTGESDDGSLHTRNNELALALDRFFSNPLFGGGPMKNSDHVIEIQLGYYLSAWGIIGILLFLSLNAFFFINAYRCRTDSDPIISIFSRANCYWIFAAFIVGMSTPTTDQIRVFQIYYLIQGIQYSIYKYRHNVIKQSVSTILQ